MKLQLLSVGKAKNPHLASLAADYAQRIQAYASFSLTEVPEYDLQGAGVAKQIQAIRQASKAARYRVALDERGEVKTSAALARWIQKLRDEGLGPLTFIVGGAYGLPEPIKTEANARLALSAMTLPHELARVVFLEQLYRAFSILAGSGYHH